MTHPYTVCVQIDKENMESYECKTLTQAKKLELAKAEKKYNSRFKINVLHIIDWRINKLVAKYV